MRHVLPAGRGASCCIRLMPLPIPPSQQSNVSPVFRHAIRGQQPRLEGRRSLAAAAARAGGGASALHTACLIAMQGCKQFYTWPAMPAECAIRGAPRRSCAQRIAWGAAPPRVCTPGTLDASTHPPTQVEGWPQPAGPPAICPPPAPKQQRRSYVCFLPWS